jgi:hypothetical protein
MSFFARRPKMKKYKRQVVAGLFATALLVASGIAIGAGSGWTVISSPSPNSKNLLAAVSGTSDSDVWAVGSQFDANQNQTILAEHWDGTNWTVSPTPNPGTHLCAPDWQNLMTGVYMAATSDVWAVGTQCTASDNYNTLVEHWNGTAWSVIPSPNKQGGETENPGSTLAAVAGSSSNDVWAAGSWAGGAWPNNGGGTLIEHWNGEKWPSFQARVPPPTSSTTI